MRKLIWFLVAVIGVSSLVFATNGWESTFDYLFRPIGKTAKTRRWGTVLGDEANPNKLTIYANFSGAYDSLVFVYGNVSGSTGKAGGGDTVWIDTLAEFAWDTDSLGGIYATEYARVDSFTFFAVKDPDIVDQIHYFDNIQEAIDSAAAVRSDTAWATVIVEGGNWDEASVRCSTYIVLEGRGTFHSNTGFIYMVGPSTVMNWRMSEDGTFLLSGDSISVINCQGGGISVYGDYCYISGCELTGILTILNGYDYTYVEGVRSNERLRVNSDYNTIVGCEFRSYDATAPADPSYLSSTANNNRLIGNVFKAGLGAPGLRVTGSSNLIQGNYIGKAAGTGFILAGSYNNYFLDNCWGGSEELSWGAGVTGTNYFYGGTRLKISTNTDSSYSLSIKDNKDFHFRGGSAILEKITIEGSHISLGHIRACTLSVSNCEVTNDSCFEFWSPVFNIENLTFLPDGTPKNVYIYGSSAGDITQTHFKGKVIISDSLIMVGVDGTSSTRRDTNCVNVTFRNCVFEDSVTYDYRLHPELDTLIFENCGFASNGLVNSSFSVATYTGLTQNTSTIADSLYGGNIYLPATTSTTGVLYSGSNTFLHRYGSITNLFVGTDAGNLTLSGTHNTGIGRNVMYYATSGDANVAIGSGALGALTTASYNTAVGVNALLNDTSTGYNTALGYQVLYTNTAGEENTGFGSEALYRNTTGDYNTGFGSYSNYYNQAGSLNVMIGYEAGKGGGLHDKSGGVYIGYMAGHNDTTDNKLYINNDSSSTPLIYGDFASDYVRMYGHLIADSIYIGEVDVDSLLMTKAYIDAAVGGGDVYLDSNNVFTGKNTLEDTTVLFADSTLQIFRTGQYVYFENKAFGAYCNYMFRGDATTERIYVDKVYASEYTTGNSGGIQLGTNTAIYTRGGYDITLDVDASGEEVLLGDVNTANEYITIDQYGDATMQAITCNGIFTFPIGYPLGADSIVITASMDTVAAPTVGMAYIDTVGGDTLKAFLNSAWEVK